MLIVGEQEEKEGAVAVRKQGDGDTGKMNIAEFVSFINEAIEEELN
jgi:threonyl-tRNA synthetase